MPNHFRAVVLPKRAYAASTCLCGYLASGYTATQLRGYASISISVFIVAALSAIKSASKTPYTDVNLRFFTK